MTFQAINLSALPQPAAVQIPSVSAILSARMQTFAGLWASAQAKDPSLPTYDVETLDSDPGVMLQTVDTYRETLVLQRINDAVLATNLAWAQKDDLDAIGQGLFNCARAAGELDTPYRLRLQLLWEQLAIGGTEGRYQSLAINAAPVDLASVAVYGAKDVSVIPPGEVWIICLGANASGVPTLGALQAVGAATSARGVRPVNDQIVVQPANVVNYSVVATLILADGADPETVVAQQTSALAAFAASRRAIGAYVSPDNIAAVLGYNSGGLVYDVIVTSPVAQVGGGPFDAPILSGVGITWRRRAS